ncbi:MAG TPA: hypothetical protein DEB42_00735 [Jeotgalicoccus sp.]|nr:hypothetical protein [Jeotgalicoccus sp.]
MEKKFLNNIVILLKGSTIAQIITFFCYLIISKLYSPTEFGEFSLIYSIISIISVVATLKIDQAIPISRKDEEAQKILFSSICISISIGILSIIIAIILGRFIESYQSVRNYSLIIGVTVFLIGLKQTFTSYSVYKNQFQLNSNNQVTRASVINVTQITFFKLGTFGLIIAQPLGHLIANLNYIKNYLPELTMIKKFNIEDFRKVLKNYKDFIFLLSPATLLNTLSANLPILVFIIAFEGYLVGLYAFAYRILLTPISMIAGAISQPFLKKMTENFSNKEYIDGFLSVLISNLYFFITFPLVMLYLFSQDLFEIFLSNEWTNLYEVVNILIPWLIFIFLTGPISQIYTVYRKHNFNLIYNIFSLIIKFLVLIVCAAEFDFYTSLKIYVLVNILLTIFQFNLLLNIASVKKINVFYKIVTSSISIITIVAPTIIVKYYLPENYYLIIFVALSSCIIYLWRLIKKLRKVAI